MSSSNASGYHLTRYLYALDEVILAFTITLFKRSNILSQKTRTTISTTTSTLKQEQPPTISEVLFWFFEYYYSVITTREQYQLKNQIEIQTQEPWNLLFTIYFDFYAYKNPMFIKHIFANYNNWQKTGNINNIILIIINLCKLSPELTHYKIPTTSNKTSTTSNKRIVWRGKTPGWVKKYPPKYQPILRLIHKYRKFHDLPVNCDTLRNELSRLISQHTCTTDVSTEKSILTNTIQEYFTQERDITNPIWDKYVNQLSVEHTNTIITTIRVLLGMSNTTSTPSPFSLASPSLKREVERMNEITAEHYPLYKSFKLKRPYSIPPQIAVFPLKRYELPESTNPIDILRYNWLQYAYNTPIWKDRLEQYGVRIITESTTSSSTSTPKPTSTPKFITTIKFPSNNMEEEFHDDYDFEPDEQPLYIQEQSTKDFPVSLTPSISLSQLISCN